MASVASRISLALTAPEAMSSCTHIHHTIIIMTHHTGRQVQLGQTSIISEIQLQNREIEVSVPFIESTRGGRGKVSQAGS